MSTPAAAGGLFKVDTHLNGNTTHPSANDETPGHSPSPLAPATTPSDEDALDVGTPNPFPVTAALSRLDGNVTIRKRPRNEDPIAGGEASKKLRLGPLPIATMHHVGLKRARPSLPSEARRRRIVKQNEPPSVPSIPPRRSATRAHKGVKNGGQFI